MSIAPMPSDEEQIRQLVATWKSATKAGDIDKVLELMTDDVVFLVPGKKFGKQEFMNNMKFHAASRIEFKGESEIEELQVLGDTAIMISHLSVKVSHPGISEVVVRSGHTLTILRKESGVWRLARDANLLTVESNENRSATTST